MDNNKYQSKTLDVNKFKDQLVKEDYEELTELIALSGIHTHLKEIYEEYKEQIKTNPATKCPVAVYLKNDFEISVIGIYNHRDRGLSADWNKYFLDILYGFMISRFGTNYTENLKKYIDKLCEDEKKPIDIKYNRIHKRIDELSQSILGGIPPQPD